MKISARVENRFKGHHVTVRTGTNERTLSIPAKEQGSGSAVNGGELLFAALGTCYCNDLYREAGKRGIEIRAVEVEVTGEFGAEGEAARHIQYTVAIDADAPRDKLLDLVRHTDSVAEVHNTLRQSSAVVLSRCHIRGHLEH